MSKKRTPGSVFARKKANRIIVTIFGKQISTGLVAYDDNGNPIKENWKLAEKSLEYQYTEYLRNSGVLPALKPVQPFFNDVWEEFIEHKRMMKISKTTMRSYIYSKKKLIPENFQLNEENVLFYLNRFNETCTLSDASINTFYRYFNVFLTWCNDKEYLPLISFCRKNKRKNADKKVVPYEIDEYDKLFGLIEKRDYEFSLLLKFMYMTGSRIKETLDLTWNKVNFATGIISFSNKINKNEEDSFPITGELDYLLFELKSLSDKRDRNKEQVFKWKSSTMSRLTRRLNDYQDELGIKIEGRAFHGIRKMFTERMIDAGASIYDLKDLMRHREIRTTMEHYKRKRMDQLKEKLEMMEKLNSTEIPQKSLESLESLKSLETEKQKIEG